MLAVYAPNTTMSGSKNAKFWNELKVKLHDQHTNVMMGNCNIVEETIDQLPQRPDAWPAVNALQSLCTHMNLTDGW